MNRSRFPALLFSLAAAACGPSASDGDSQAAGFAGAARCAECHAAESDAWRGSQHARAMQVAGPNSVLGRFDRARLTHDGATTTFLRRGDRFVVNTEGPDGRLADFDVAYTFGVFPLQQYIVALPGGRYQPLPYAWDARPASEGGNRWFSLDPTPRPLPADQAHWAGRYANWNHMCADCHSTGVRKGYDASADTFHTTWSGIDVACEACHGPSSRHVAWAARPRLLRWLWRTESPPARLTERRGVRWAADSSGRVLARSTARTTDREIEVCAQCHARRVHVADGYTAGAPFFDYYDPELITPGLYHPDGQQLAEVYTYGSFLQSRMYAAGVTCSDCHDPHTGQLRRPGNEVCAQCHLATRYDTSAHHHHRAGAGGIRCVDCHMPDTVYMGIDRRHDHGIRVPRPDLAARLGLPDACARCHRGRDPRWEAQQLREWYGHDPAGFQRFAGAFATDEYGERGAADSLDAVARDATEPAIVRASALARLAGHPGPVALEAARRGVRDRHALVRRAALEILASFPPRERVAIAAPLLADSARIVRLRAAWMLAPVGDSLVSIERRRDFAGAAAEFIASQHYNADRVANRLTLGAFYAARGQLDSAEVESRAAIRLGPTIPQGYLNLAGVLIARGRLTEAEGVLRQGTAKVPGDAELASVHAAVRDSLRRLGR